MKTITNKNNKNEEMRRNDIHTDLIKIGGYGTNVTARQRGIMWHNRHNINKGPNSLNGKPYPYVYDSKTGQMGVASHFLNLSKMLGR